MRPKTQILLIDADADRAGVLRFLLTTRGYAVFSARTAAEALRVCAACAPEAAVIAWPCPGGEKTLKGLRRAAPYMNTMALAEGIVKRPVDATADVVLWGHWPAEYFLDRLRVLAGRKRGPRKVALAPVPARQPVIQEQHYGAAGAVVPVRRIA